MAALVAAPLAGVASAPAGAAPAAPTDGEGFSVARVPGGYEVTVELDTPLPIRSDAPTVVVDGEPVGIATESADGRSLSVVTADPAVLRADTVTAGWASQSTADPGAARSAAVEVPDAVEAQALAADPAAPGEFDWTESIYKFGDQAIPLAAIGGVRGELEGKVYLPTTGGARPTVLLLHGRHTSCYGATGTVANPNRWPCPTAPGLPADQTRYSIPSYAGYDGTARALASHGYAVVSISANAVNSNDNQLAADQGAQARGQLLLDTLTLLEQASAGEAVSYYDAWEDRTVTLDQALLDGASSYAVRREGFTDNGPDLDVVTAADLRGRFDLTTIGMMGHSRGGEGVTSAATLNQALEDPWDIESILPLAPVDFARMTVPDVPMNVLLPYCDGDVSNQQGQHMLDDSRYAFGDDVLRSGTWVMGANHNFYNTAWTPGAYKYSVSDDWSGTNPASARATEPVCGTAPSTAATSIRMTPQEQYDQGTTYMTGWFRLTLGAEDTFLPMFDGTGEVPEALGGEDVRTQATAPSSARSTITDFEAPSSLVRASGTATATPCASLSGRTVAQTLPACATTLGSAQAPHWTPASNGGNVPATPLTRLAWTDGTGLLRVTVPAGKRDAADFERVSVKVAADETVATGTDLTMAVVDGAGRTWSAPVSTLNPLALVRMPTSASTAATTTLKKVVLQQANVPVADLAAAGLDVGDLREVRFAAAVGADGTPAGAAYLSDLAFERSSVGTAVARTQPVIDVYAPGVDEGEAPGTVDLAVHLDEPAAAPVTGYVSLLGSSTSRAGATMEKVTFAPGETCKPVTAAVQGDDADSTSNGTTVKASVINTSGAVMGRKAVVFMSIREDDGLLPSTNPPAPAPSPLPAYGTPGPVCEELAGVLAGGTAQTAPNATPGGDTVVTGGGFRPGEAVVVAADGVPPVTAVADGTGTASATLALPADVARGSVPLTVTGAGTGRVLTGALAVRDTSTTTLALDPAAPVLREPVTLRATVAGGDTTGTVEFIDGTTSLGTAPVTDGVATLEVAGFGAGEHALTAVFAQSDVTTGSTSAPVAFTLTRRASTAVVSVDSPSSVFGERVTVGVAVSGASGGEVAISAAGQEFTVPVGADGRASYLLPVLPAGTSEVTARFTGTADVEPSPVSTTTLRVSPKQPAVTVSAPARARAGDRITIVVRTGGAVAGYPVTGPVQILVRGAASREAVRTLADGRATVVTTMPARGARLLVAAVYPGTGNYGPARSATVVVTRR